MRVGEERDDTTQEPDPREERLPKWAKDSFRQLRLRLDEARKQARRAAYEGETDTYYDPYASIPGKLKPGMTVTFVLGDDGFGGDVYIQAKIRRFRDEVALELHGSGTLLVQGNSSNVLLVNVKER